MIESNISKIIEKYKTLHKDLKERIMKDEATVMLDLLHKGFKKQESPYGSPWPKKKDGTIFDPNHDLENSFGSSNTRDTAVIQSSFVSAIYHQYGTDKLPERKMIPEEGKGFGTWKGPMLSAARRAVKTTMDGSYVPLPSTYTASIAKIAARVAHKAIRAKARADVKSFIKKQRAESEKKYGYKPKSRVKSNPKPKLQEWQKIANIKHLVRELR